MEETRNEFKFVGGSRRWKEDNTKMDRTEVWLTAAGSRHGTQKDVMKMAIKL
jgi:hypothetical protein